MKKENRITPSFISVPGGPVLGLTDTPLLDVDGLKFKDLERCGELLPYEDWRLSARERAEDLAKRLSTEEIAGLMLYSPHQMVPSLPGMPFPATYGQKSFPESGEEAWAISDQLHEMIADGHVRHILLMRCQDTGTAANWSNAVQALCESLPHGIPANVCSDPRHGAGQAGAEYKSDGSDTSKWPEGLAMAAAFDPELCREAAEIISREYRALGITTALSPQLDLGTEPRWMRVEDTFGPSPELVTEMGRVYCEAMQGTEENDAGRCRDGRKAGAEGETICPDTGLKKREEEGWGSGSVNTMAKHWPGGGPCEGGRDAHYPYGKFAVYPGKNLEAHLKPFKEGAFALKNRTEKTAAVMPYYTVSWDVDPSGERAGNSYSRYIIDDMLRRGCGYDGVICTDWGITADPEKEVDSFSSRCYGAHQLTEAERHLKILENGVDQFGGNSSIEPVLEAYRIGCGKYGEAAMRRRFEESAVRILINIFRCGLFENPYLDPEESCAIVGNEEHCRKGFEAQLRSVVMVKNSGVLPVRERKKVYVPGRHLNAHKNFFRMPVEAEDLPGADQRLLSSYYEIVDQPEDADFALCMIESPLSDGYDAEKGYQPVTLQYRPYTAVSARSVSIAGGDFREESKNRSYLGKTNRPWNESDLDLVLDTKKAMGDRPVICVIRMHNPCVLSELEPFADAILVQFGVQQAALFEIIAGKREPSALLPVQLPADMKTVEEHCEDLPFDMTAYTDTAGNCYDFGFGMNWSGPIRDGRAQKYAH